MKAPARLQSLIDEGLIDSVQRQLMSGKEAMVYVVRCGDETRCAKVYKEATQRSFRQAVDYTENRKVKNSRQARAMAKGTRFGREAQEAAWQSAEVDALYRLAAAGVRVPRPYNFHDGVLLMELVADADGAAAPRLNDMQLHAEEARTHHATLIARWCACCAPAWSTATCRSSTSCWPPTGPVIIDLPQAVDAAGNNHAQRMLLRDVDNLRDFFGRFAPELLATHYGPEIWSLYERGLLQADTPLTGRYEQQHGAGGPAPGDARDRRRARRRSRAAAAHADGVSAKSAPGRVAMTAPTDVSPAARAVAHPADDAAQHAVPVDRLPDRLPALARRGRGAGGPGAGAGR